jgi:hypothetical protein
MQWLLADTVTRSAALTRSTTSHSFTPHSPGLVDHSAWAASELRKAFASDSQLVAEPLQMDSTAGLRIRASYTRVAISRPWMDPSLLAMNDWYLPGRSRADLSNGVADNTTGLLKFLPTVLLVVKDLLISADWSPDNSSRINRALDTAYPSAFGPFRIAQGYSTFDGTTVSCSGHQFLGCLVERLPLSPPMDAPNGTNSQTHVVQAGDTLWALAERYYQDGTKWTIIATANGITDPNNLPIGNSLIIPIP